MHLLGQPNTSLDIKGGAADLVAGLEADGGEAGAEGRVADRRAVRRRDLPAYKHLEYPLHVSYNKDRIVHIHHSVLYDSSGPPLCATTAPAPCRSLLDTWRLWRAGALLPGA